MSNQPPFDFNSAAREAREANRRLNLAANARYIDASSPDLGWKSQDDPAWRAWEEAVDEVHSALACAFPPGFGEAHRGLKSGDPSGVKAAIDFLEADPWFFRSGYVKEALLRALRRLELTPTQQKRVRRVILKRIRARDGREFRQYCRLAGTLDTRRFRSDVRKLAQDEDSTVRRRANWVLYYCQHRRFQPTAAPKFPEGLTRAYAQLQTGDADGLDAAISYLESRAWTPRKNFVKWTLVGLIGTFDLPPEQAERLRRLVVREIEGPPGETFQRFNLIAPRVCTGRFVEQLRGQFRDAASGQVWRRIEKIIEVCRAPGQQIFPREIASWASTGWTLEAEVSERNLIQRLRARDMSAANEVISNRFFSAGRSPLVRLLIRLIGRYDLETADRETLRALLPRTLSGSRPAWVTYVPILRQIIAPDLTSRVRELLIAENPATRTNAAAVLAAIDICHRFKLGKVVEVSGDSSQWGIAGSLTPTSALPPA